MNADDKVRLRGMFKALAYAHAKVKENVGRRHEGLAMISAVMGGIKELLVDHGEELNTRGNIKGLKP